MLSTYQSPVVVRKCGDLPLTLPPSDEVSTLILHDVSALSLGEQQVLSDWLSRKTRGSQVVATSSVALFPLVQSGAFQTMLYYRLNLIYVEVTASPAAMEPTA
jgi:hypothetical protein